MLSYVCLVGFARELLRIESNAEVHSIDSLSLSVSRCAACDDDDVVRNVTMNKSI